MRIPGTILATAILAMTLVPAALMAQEEPTTRGTARPVVSPAPEAEKAAPTSEPAGEQDQRRTQPSNPFDWKFILLLGGGFLLLWLFSTRGKRKQEQKHRDMLANLKKGDRVTSIGGIIGTVVEVREDELVVKVDDSSRIHLARWAVRGVGEAAKTQAPEDKK